MRQLVLAQEELFQGVHCDVWMDKNRNPLMTLEQAAKALEYKRKRGVEQIVERNAYLKDSEFSVLARVPLNLGGTQEMRLFTFDGIMEVSFLSSKPKAREFRAWARKVLKAFMHGQLVWREKRESGKDTRQSLTDTIKELGLSPHYYKHYSDLAYKSALGFNATQLKQARNISKGGKVRDCLSSEELAAVTKREDQISAMLELGMEYRLIKETLANNGVILSATLKTPVMSSQRN